MYIEIFEQAGLISFPGDNDSLFRDRLLNMNQCREIASLCLVGVRRGRCGQPPTDSQKLITPYE